MIPELAILYNLVLQRNSESLALYMWYTLDGIWWYTLDGIMQSVKYLRHCVRFAEIMPDIEIVSTL